MVSSADELRYMIQHAGQRLACKIHNIPVINQEAFPISGRPPTSSVQEFPTLIVKKRALRPRPPKSSGVKNSVMPTAVDQDLEFCLRRSVPPQPSNASVVVEEENLKSTSPAIPGHVQPPCQICSPDQNVDALSKDEQVADQVLLPCFVNRASLKLGFVKTKSNPSKSPRIFARDAILIGPYPPNYEAYLAHTAKTRGECYHSPIRIAPPPRAALSSPDILLVEAAKKAEKTLKNNFSPCDKVPSGDLRKVILTLNANRLKARLAAYQAKEASEEGKTEKAGQSHFASSNNNTDAEVPPSN